MKKKYVLSAFLGLLLSTPIFAQNNSGINYFNTGEFELAKEVLESQVASSPASSYYYLGQIALQEEDQNKAKSFFEKGLAASPEDPYNNIGLASLLFKTDAKAAEKILKDIAKNNKKDVTVLSEVARAYYANNMVEQAEKVINDAIKVDKTSPLPYLVQGDFKAKTDIGAAAGAYALAINADPNAMDAYVKTGKIYQKANPELAAESLNKALEINPNFNLAYKYLGDIYYSAVEYPKAIESYKKYFEKGGDHSADEIRYFAAAYYFNDQYPEASALITEGLQKAPDDFVLNRLSMYVDASTEKEAEGLATAKKFFALPTTKTNKFIAKDYMVYGGLLSKNNQGDLALAEYEKAVELDPTNVSIYKDVAESSSDSEDYLNSGLFYEKYLQKVDTANIVPTDYFNMGRNFYYAGAELSQDTVNTVESAALAKEVYDKSAKAFQKVVELVPESLLGYLWTAKVYVALDPNVEQGLAKPYYEKLIEEAKKKKDDKGTGEDELIEAYGYMAYYYYKQYIATKNEADKNSVIEYCNLLLELDPSNGMAPQLLGAVK